MPDCVFCKIVKKELPAEVVYEDNDFLAFLDIHPVNPGHTLLIPKAHYPRLTDTPDEVVATLFPLAKKIINQVQLGVGADFAVLSIVGIDVPHLHLHLVPRWHSDGLRHFWPTKEYKPGELKLVAEKIRRTP